jgi:hypothetical protein
MNQGKYVFSQIIEFIPQRQFERIMTKYKDRIGKWGLTSWNQMLVLMFGQLDDCNSLRELTDITTAHARKSFHLGFGGTPINRNTSKKTHQTFSQFLFIVLYFAGSGYTTIKAQSAYVAPTLPTIPDKIFNEPQEVLNNYPAWKKKWIVKK